MMIMKKVFITILICFGLAACEDNESNEVIVDEVIVVDEPVDELAEYKKLINENLATKLNAINLKDLELYMSTVTSNNKYYYNEQKRWFDEMTSNLIKDLTLELKSLSLNNETELVVNVHQTHSYQQDFDFEYELVYRLENNKWKDCGFNFVVVKRDGFLVKYQKDETHISELIGYFTKAYNIINNAFSKGVDDNFEIKLFTDRELFRQRTIPTIPVLFTGWGEPDESLKVPEDVKISGFDYFLEVSVALEVLESLEGKPSSLDDKLRLLIYYAENDSYPDYIY